MRRSKRISGFVKLRSIVYDAFSFMPVIADVKFAFHVIFVTTEYVLSHLIIANYVFSEELTVKQLLKNHDYITYAF